MLIRRLFRRWPRQACGHPREARQHYRKGSDCALCYTEARDVITKARVDQSFERIARRIVESAGAPEDRP